MNAIPVPRYGSIDTLTVTDVERPTPKPREVLIRVAAASANPADIHIVHGTPLPIRLMFGLTRPRITAVGSDVAGRVEAVGDGVTEFAPGDEVFGELSGAGCGAFAEYGTAPASLLARKPRSVGFAETAAIPIAGLTALQALRDHGRLQAGQRVLVVGASGGVGTFAVQLAKMLGAEVTGVCRTAKVETVRALDPDHIVDHTEEDVTKNGRTYDLIVDAGAYRSIFDYADSLTPTGRYVLIGGSMARFAQAGILGPLRSRKGGKRYISFMQKTNRADLEYLAGLVESGTIRPVIGARFSLEDAVEGLQALEAGRVPGKIVIEIAE